MANRIYDYDKSVESGNSYKKSLYTEKLNYECSNPFCTNGMDPEVHHIIPLSVGGMDRYYNYILLCHYCHRSSGVHSHWEFMQPILNDWKTNQELRVLGFMLEEGADKYHENVLRLINAKPKEIKTCVLRRERFHDKKMRIQSESRHNSKNTVPLSYLVRTFY